MSRARPWVLLLLVLAIAAGVLAEWTARRIAPARPDPTSAVCRVAAPSPAIGAESGASAITRDYERHPTLGWVPTERSPHHPKTARIPRDGGAWIALFGDASLAGGADPRDGSLAARLDAALATPVVSYAVAGHRLERIVARFVETISAAEPAPRTALVGLRVDGIEHVWGSAEADTSWLDHSRLLELARGGLSTQPGAEAGAARGCIREPDLVLLRERLRALRAAAESRDVELVVSLHPPAVPGVDQTRAFELWQSELDALAIHRVDAWDPSAELGAREQVAFAAAQLERRLARAADYVWGTRIGFGKAEAVERYRSSGLGTPDEDSRWMVEPVARLLISPPPSSEGIVADIEFQRAVTFEDDARELVLRVGEVAVARWPLWRLRKRWHDTFFIDEGIAEARPLEFHFELASLRSPHELGRGPDKNQYGAAIASLILKPEQKP